MPVIAHEVVSRTPHDKTDQLFIYEVTSPTHGSRVIVANLTNVYEPGDIAAVALPGTFLEEAEIKPRKVFGVDSSGMMLGKVDDPVDADLTARFDADHPERPFTVVLEVVVDGRYATDAEKAARKALGKGEGRLVSAAPL